MHRLADVQLVELVCSTCMQAQRPAQAAGWLLTFHMLLAGYIPAGMDEHEAKSRGFLGEAGGGLLGAWLGHKLGKKQACSALQAAMSRPAAYGGSPLWMLSASACVLL